MAKRWATGGYVQSSLARRALQLGLRVVRVWEYFPEASPGHPPIPENATLRRLTHYDITRFAREPDLQINRAAFDFAFDHGHMPLGLFLDDTLVNYVIFGRDAALGPDGMIVRLDPGLAYIWNAFTHPSFRGQRLMEVRVHLQRVNWHELAWDYSATRFASYIDLYNYSSMAATKRLGNDVVGYAGYWNAGGRCFRFRDPSVAAMGLRFDRPTPAEAAYLD